MKIAAFGLEEWERSAFQMLSDEHALRLVTEPLGRENSSDFADAEVISTFIYSSLDQAVLEQLTSLKMIATRSTGYDHIDLDYCKQRGIGICNVPTYGANTVAEHVFGLLLTVSHKLDQAIDRTRKGDFSPRGLQGFDLYGKTVGVVGTGSIGKHAIRIAKGFGMEIIAFDIQHDKQAAQELGFRYVEMEKLLRQSDVITLHVPSNEHTRHMLSDPQFEQMKEGVVIINTSRGDVIDSQALIRGLAEGKVAGAGLDVLAEEPVIREEAELLRSVYQRKHNLEALLADQVLIRLRNVVVTPHSAFNTREAVLRILDTTVDNIAAFAEGNPKNLVGEVADSR